MASHFDKWMKKLKRIGSKSGHKKPKEPLDHVERKLTRMGNFKKRMPTNFQNVSLESINAHSNWIKWGLIVLTLFLAAEITTWIIANFLPPVYNRVADKTLRSRSRNRTAKNYQSIKEKNIFNVEGKIPPPFDQGLLDCLSQAQPSSQRLTLLGTIVMKDDKFSVALVEQQGGEKIAIKKDDSFGNGRFKAMEIRRQKFCFQVTATQDLQYIEVKDSIKGLGGSGLQFSGPSSGGIKVLSSTERQIGKSFLEDKMKNLNEILQTARAVPNIDAQGNFEGFLIQSIQPDSVFYELGVRQGDILTGVNDIVLDNAGKGLEAFNQLRNTDRVNLEIIRGGRRTNLKFFVK